MDGHRRFTLLLCLLVLIDLLSPSMAEIKSLTISDDSRYLILFEKFGFTHTGAVEIAVSDVSVSPASNPSVLGFFLLSDESLIQAAYDSEQQEESGGGGGAGPEPICVLDSPYVRRLFTLAEVQASTGGAFKKTFDITHPDEYSLFFASCALDGKVSMAVRTEMYNSRPDGSRDYLSVGQSAMPSIYGFFALAYVVFLAVWIYISFFKNKVDAHRIHHIMAGLLLTKALCLVFAAADLHFTRKTGTAHGWDILFYVFQFVKGVLLFTVIVLIGTGWSFLKPFLQEREKKVLMAVIPLQVIANIATVVVGETGPFIPNYGSWIQLFLLIDIICCCAILFPIIWSIRSLRETSKTDGKAARNLAKLTLFRQFYIVVIGYLYFTRIVVYALKTIASYKYQWVSAAAEETVSLAFYLFMFYMFRPEEKNQYLALDDEEEEAAELALRQDDFEL